MNNNLPMQLLLTYLFIYIAYSFARFLGFTIPIIRIGISYIAPYTRFVCGSSEPYFFSEEECKTLWMNRIGSTFLYHFGLQEHFVSFLFALFFLYQTTRLLQHIIGERRTFYFFLTSLVVVPWLTFMVIKVLGIEMIYYEGIFKPASIALLAAAAVISPQMPLFFFFVQTNLKTLFIFFISFSVLVYLSDPSATFLGEIIGALLGGAYGVFYKVRDGKHSPVFKVKTPRSTSKKANENRSFEASTSKPYKGKPSQEEIHRLLDKIEREGYQALTEEEKRRLLDM